MPLFLEPGEGFHVVLDSDKDKPIELRPLFVAAAQSMRGQRQIGRVLDLAESADLSVDDLFEKTLDEVMRVITGWKNIGQTFSRTAVEETISFQEAREILRKVLSQQYLTGDEKKG